MKTNMNTKTRKKIALTTAVTLIAGHYTAPVYAQSREDVFTGLKAGVQAGWERSRINESVLDGANLTDVNKGFSYGLYAGYDRQYGNMVLGVEAGFSPDGQTLRTAVPGGSVVLNSKWSADLSARAGYTLAPNLLAYGRLGYSINRYKVLGFNAGSPNAVASESATGDGFMYGGGLEYALGSNVSMRAEYRYRDLGGSLKTKQVLGGISYHF